MKTIPLNQSPAAIRARSDAAQDSADRTAIDLLGAHIAVIDADGFITATNRCWDLFALDHGARLPAVSEGANYLAACDVAAAAGDALAQAAGDGIRQVICGERESFEIEYPCHGGQEHRWFVCRAMAFGAPDRPRVMIVHENVTEIRAAQIEAERRRDMFEAVTRGSPTGMFQLDRSGNAHQLNTYFEELVARQSHEVVGHGWWRFLHPDDHRTAAAAWQDFLDHGHALHVELRFLRPDGSQRWAVVRVSPLRSALEAPMIAVATITDTTDRKRMEQCLRAVSVDLADLDVETLLPAAVSRLAEILAIEIAFVAVPVGMQRARTLAVVVDGAAAPDFEYQLEGSPCGEVLAGAPAEYPHGLRKRFPDDPVAANLEADAYAGVALVNPRGETIGLLAVASRRPFHRSANLSAMLHLFATRLAAALDRQHSEAHFRDLFEFSPDAMVRTDGNGMIVVVNRATERMFGFGRKELIGSHVEMLLSQSSSDPQWLAGGRIRPGSDTDGELFARRRDGTTFPIQIRVGAIGTPQGVNVVAVMRDITERRTAELARFHRQQAVHLRIAIDDAFAGTAPLEEILPSIAGTLRLDLDVALVDVCLFQAESSDLHFCSPEAVAGADDSRSAIFTPDVLRLIASGGNDWRLEELDRFTGGAVGRWSRRHGFADVAACALPAGDLPRGCIVVHTRTALTDPVVETLSLAASVLAANMGRRAAETGLRELATGLERRVAERTAELETANRDLDAFAASVSHDLRAPIRHVEAFANILRNDLHDRLNAEEARILDSLLSSNRQMNEIVSALLSVARANRAAIHRRTIPLASLVSEIATQAMSLVPDRHVSFEVGDLPDVSGDPTLIRQVLENLISNAIKYTRLRPDARIEIGCTAVVRGHAELFVRDNGIGFAMVNAERLFEMFQRLHSATEFEGNGVGLATVRRILERHGCSIRAESRPGEGSAFRFTLPVS